MGCQIHSLTTQHLYRTHGCTIIAKQSSTCFSSFYSKIKQPISATTIKKIQVPAVSESDVYSVKFKTLGACKLGISRYPDFQYNAEGGGGSGTATKTSENNSNSDLYVEFDVETLYIPPLSTATTKFLGLPLPPFLKIDIVPEVLRGNINKESGKVDLRFSAKFLFSVGSIYRAPPLMVETTLTSEESIGKIRRGRGEKLNQQGQGVCRLVGVATVQPINDLFMDTFLSLPTECLAELNAMIAFSTTRAVPNLLETLGEEKKMDPSTNFSLKNHYLFIE